MSRQLVRCAHCGATDPDGTRYAAYGPHSCRRAALDFAGLDPARLQAIAAEDRNLTEILVDHLNWLLEVQRS